MHVPEESEGGLHYVGAVGSGFSQVIKVLCNLYSIARSLDAVRELFALACGLAIICRPCPGCSTIAR